MSDSPSSFVEALNARALVLDGGLSEQLLSQGCDLAQELWTARLLMDDPEQVYDAHRAYAGAGARVLITSSYQATAVGFQRHGADEHQVPELFGRSVRLARRAAVEAEGQVWVAGSVGPYGAALADGSEYRGRYGLSVRELTRFHQPRVEALAESAPDVLALETVPDVVEAEALLRAVEGIGLPVWLSYTVAGGRTRAGQPLAEAFALAADNEQVCAVGVNCCAPEEVADAVELAVRVTGKPAVAYPNSGEGYVDGRWHGSPTLTVGQALRWRTAGARLVGGCCRVGPEYIADLARALRAA